MMEINIDDISKAPIIEESQKSSKETLIAEIQGPSRIVLKELFKQLEDSQEHGSPCKEGMILSQIGDLLEKEGYLHKALAYYQASYRTAEKFQDFDDQGAVLLRLGSVLLKLGLHEAALDSLQKAHQLYEKFTRQTSNHNNGNHHSEDSKK
ncbi:MAG: tetratricopeptide repeat protein [Candidatus Hodarchaeota archaeon]